MTARRVVAIVAYGAALVIAGWVVWVVYEMWCVGRPAVVTGKVIKELRGDADRYFQKHPGEADPSLIAGGILEQYRSRTGQSEPRDAWGGRIVVEATVKNNVRVIVLRSAGRDGVLETADDITSRLELDVPSFPN